MSDGFQRQLRTYRLWRTATVLLIVGAVEFGVLAYQRQSWLVGLIMVPLVAFAMVAARRAAGLARRLRRDLAVEVELWDERFTTAAGERILRGSRAPKSARDRLAAILILQSYLDRRNAGVP